MILLLGAGYARAGERDVVYRDRTPCVAAASAPALAFASPGPIVAIPREDRQLQAFVGYESGVVTAFYIRTDDFQQGDWCGSNGFAGREAITETIGVRFR